jgi:hypothetical protein
VARSVAEQKKAKRIDFNSIYGRKATLHIKLIKNSSHKKPFRNIELVLPLETAFLPGGK